MWDNRNDHMTTYVVDLLEKNTEGDYFVIVGSGHMVNDNGIVAQLEALGFEVELVK